MFFCRCVSFFFFFSRLLDFALIFLSTPDLCFSHFAAVAALSAAALVRGSHVQRCSLTWGSSCIGELLGYIACVHLKLKQTLDVEFEFAIEIVHCLKCNSTHFNVI